MKKKTLKKTTPIPAAILALLLGQGMLGCAGSQFAKTIGAYAGVDLEFGYKNQGGDPKGGGISGTLDPAHGNFGPSTFKIDRSDQYPEHTVTTGFRILLRPE